MELADIFTSSNLILDTYIAKNFNELHVCNGEFTLMNVRYDDHNNSIAFCVIGGLPERLWIPVRGSVLVQDTRYLEEPEDLGVFLNTNFSMDVNIELMQVVIKYKDSIAIILSEHGYIVNTALTFNGVPSKLWE